MSTRNPLCFAKKNQFKADSKQTQDESAAYSMFDREYMYGMTKLKTGVQLRLPPRYIVGQRPFSPFLLLRPSFANMSRLKLAKLATHVFRIKDEVGSRDFSDQV